MTETTSEVVTAAVEEAPATEEPKERITRRALYAKKIRERRDEIARLVARITELRRVEDEARLASLTEAPGQSAYSLNSRAQRARRDREEASKKLAVVELELTDLEMLEREVGDEEGLLKHQERRARLRSLRAGEAQSIKRMGELLAELAEVYVVDYCLAVEQIDELAHPSTVVRVPAALREDWKSEALPVVSLFAADLTNMLARLIDSSFDPGRAGFRETKNPATARSDYGRALPGLTSDPRGTLRSPALSVLEASRSRPGRAAQWSG